MIICCKAHRLIYGKMYLLYNESRPTNTHFVRDFFQN